MLRHFDVPGVALAALSNCKLEGVTVAGQADLQRDMPVTPQTAFEAASLSKPVFSYLVLTLVDEGVIALDRPMAETFDYPRIPDKASYAKLTPRLVLTHRTGLPNWVDGATPFHRRTAPIAFQAKPGTKFSYSGEAFQLLQAFVERQTGKPLQQLFRERLGAVMPNSTFALPLPDSVSPSRGYASARAPGSGRGMTNLYDEGMAASSLVTTAADYAGFLGHVCRRQGLREVTLADMLTPQTDVPSDQAPVPSAYGLGWLIAQTPEGRMVGHGGNNDEYRAMAGYFPKSGEGLVILTNGAKGQALIDAIIAPPPGR